MMVTGAILDDPDGSGTPSPASSSCGSASSTPKREPSPMGHQETKPPTKKPTANEPGLDPQNPRLLSSLYNFLVIVSIFLIGFAAFRNTLTWHLQRFWGASGDFWQAHWDRFIDFTGEDPATLWVLSTTIFTVFVYWFFGGIYTMFDLTCKPACIRRYKMQPGTNEPVDRTRLAKVIAQVLMNQTVIGIPMAVFMYQAMRFRGLNDLRELPTFHWVLAELAFCIFIEEIGFYYAHRLLHNRHIYKYIHKQHHEWTAPIAITAIYCHPVEHVFSNLVPPFLGIFMLGSHVAVAWLWFTLVILSTLNAHSGYHLPFFPSPEAHDFHHLKFNQCFGVLGVLDRLHGTDTLFRNTKAYARHIMMLSFMPAREAFPEPAKKAF
uniref:Putative fatty acid hydroxylase domain-containing protein 2 n=1 Tax=Culex tarsalis TaxID=7177 RepID=A0A1Q3G4B5_CULTA